jgi:hypothetical protein
MHRALVHHFLCRERAFRCSVRKTRPALFRIPSPVPFDGVRETRPARWQVFRPVLIRRLWGPPPLSPVAGPSHSAALGPSSFAGFGAFSFAGPLTVLWQV